MPQVKRGYVLKIQVDLKTEGDAASYRYTPYTPVYPAQEARVALQITPPPCLPMAQILRQRPYKIYTQTLPSSLYSLTP